MTDKAVYEEFIKWLGKTWVEFPESEYLRPMIKSYYTPDEAKFLTDIPFAFKNLEELSDIKDMEPGEVASKLKELAKKGMVEKRTRGGTDKYRLSDSFFVFFGQACGTAKWRNPSRVQPLLLTSIFQIPILNNFATLKKEA